MAHKARPRLTAPNSVLKLRRSGSGGCEARRGALDRASRESAIIVIVGKQHLTLGLLAQPISSSATTPGQPLRATSSLPRLGLVSPKNCGPDQADSSACATLLFFSRAHRCVCCDTIVWRHDAQLSIRKSLAPSILALRLTGHLAWTLGCERHRQRLRVMNCPQRLAQSLEGNKQTACFVIVSGAPGKDIAPPTHRSLAPVVRRFLDSAAPYAAVIFHSGHARPARCLRA